MPRSNRESFEDIEEAFREGAPQLSPERKAALGQRIMASLGGQEMRRHWWRRAHPVRLGLGAAAAAAAVATFVFVWPVLSGGRDSTEPATVTTVLQPGDAVEAPGPLRLVLAPTGAELSLDAGASLAVGDDGSVQLLAGSMTIAGRIRILGNGWETQLAASSVASVALAPGGAIIDVTAGSVVVISGSETCNAAAPATIVVPAGGGCAVTMPSPPETPAQQAPPGNSGDAPGPPVDPPGNSGDAPGPPVDPPANPGDRPGPPADPPGNSGDPPGPPVDPPGNSGDPPGPPDDPPGNSGDAPGPPVDPPGNSGDAPGNQRR